MNLTAIPPGVRAALYWCGYVIGVLGQGLTIVWGAVAASSPDVSMPTWLVIASAILGLLQTQLNLLAGSNVTTDDTPARVRDEGGRVRPLLALAAAMVLAIAGVLVALVPSPAQAYGWTGVRCDLQTGNAAKVCVAVHTIPSGGGLRVDQVQLCAYKVPQLYFNGFRATKESTMQFWGSGGNYLGFINLSDTDASVNGTCAYTNAAFQMGNQACYHAYGTLDLPGPDAFYGIDGKVLGGAC